MNKTKFKLILDSCTPIECRDIKIEETLQAIKFCKNCLAIYSNNDEVEVLFTGFNEELLNDLIIALCSHKELFTFLKLGLISAEKIKKFDKKGMDFAASAASYIKNKLQNL